MRTWGVGVVALCLALGTTTAAAADPSGVAALAAEYEAIGKTLGNATVQRLAADARARIEALPAVTRDAVEGRIAGLQDARAAARDLGAKLGGARLAAPASPAGGPSLPSAPYSSLCGSSRASTDAVFASELALFTAEEIREEASRACDEVIVVLGEGGNASLVCIATDLVYIAAKSANLALTFCDGDIDSAEIEGSYDRLEHVHADVAILDAKLDELLAKADEAIRLAIEASLHDGGIRLAHLYLPASVGGRLELVRAIVGETIDRSVAAGLDVAFAPKLLAEGDQQYAALKYREAFNTWKRAYKLVVRLR